MRLERSLVSLMVLAACARPGKIVSGLGNEPAIRVAVVAGAPSAVISGQGNVRVSSEGKQIFRLPRGQRVTIRVAGNRVSISGSGRSGSYRSLRVRPASSGGLVTVNGKAYRGTVDLYAGDGDLFAVNELGIERYLASVVTAEMGRLGKKDLEALKAQAVLARTYALKNRGKFKARGYDVRASVADQVYPGAEAENDLSMDAVRKTVGQVLTFRGQLIQAFFHSTCATRTALPEEVFSTVQSEPYLKSVSDKKPGGGYYSDISPRFSWTEEWTRGELLTILKRTIPARLGIESAALDGLKDLRVNTRGPSGRATEIRIEVEDGEIPVFGPDIRYVLETPGGSPLNSTAIRLESHKNGGIIDHLVAQGTGYGHGVGMCQWGAIGRARNGQKFPEILTTYFPGTKVERVY